MTITISGSTGLSGVDGTSSSPAIEGSDTDTGIFFPAAGAVAITNNGTESIRVNADAQVEFKDGSATLPTVAHSGDLNTGLFFPASDTIGVTTAGSERFRFGSAGQLGIGGATYGTSGQVLTSGGSVSAPTWATATTITSLGSVATTSGNSVSISGLTLTPYRLLLIVPNAVSSNTGTAPVFISSDNNQTTNAGFTLAAAASTYSNPVIISLDNGSQLMGLATNSLATTTYTGPITTATTTIYFRLGSTFTWDAGSIAIYGMR